MGMYVVYNFLIFLFSFLPPVLLLRLFLFFFLNIHFYPKVSSIEISHPFFHPFIHSFIHSFTPSVSFTSAIHQKAYNFILTFFLSLSFLISASFSFVCIELFVLFFRFFSPS